MPNLIVRELKDRKGESYVVRQATPADAAQVLAFIDRVCHEASEFLLMEPGEVYFTVDDETDYLTRLFYADNSLGLIAQRHGEIVGFLNFDGGQRRKVRHAGEFGMSVRQSHWGLGIGGSLIDLLIEWAAASHVVRKVNLRVFANNDRGMRLYRSRGFVEEGRLSRQIFHDGRYLDEILMSRWVGNAVDAEAVSQ
ncbi:MAG: GNAT family N-acetyltransferase [Candidatus Wallbacteria bacterium]|nr:GNAT family N-acetyltransferase [Candidatus Wallbacteria bacterium]